MIRRKTDRSNQDTASSPETSGQEGKAGAKLGIRRSPAEPGGLRDRAGRWGPGPSLLSSAHGPWEARSSGDGEPSTFPMAVSLTQGQKPFGTI